MVVAVVAAKLKGEWAGDRSQRFDLAGSALYGSALNAVMGAVERRYYAVASATLATMRLLGQMVSMGLAMLVFAVLLGDSRVTAETQGDFVGAVRVAFGLFAALSVVGTLASMVRGRTRT